MLTKSQARGFFLFVTVGFSAVFLWLTVDSIHQVGARSHEENLSAEVIRGKTLWDQNNCMGCHTLLGEGAYYAPELTKVYGRRGPAWMNQFLKDPEAMFPGQRKMVKYDFTDAERSDLIAFFKWMGEIDTNGFPAVPDLAPAPPPSVTALASAEQVAAAPEIFRTTCVGCHAVGGSGGSVGPALDGEGARRDAAWLEAWLTNPAAIKPDTKMPNLQLPADTRTSLVTWLGSLK